IQRNVTRPLNSIPKEDFLQSSQDMYSRSQRCIIMGGDYFEGHHWSMLDKPQTLDHLEDNIRRVIADIRPQMLEKVIEIGRPDWTTSEASRGSPMPEIIFKM
ncbi:hypothetical protein TNCV_2157731, partial [Trichonephila clavipes]